MESSSSNDDDEPKICTVFSSSSTTADTQTKTIFDTISFTKSSSNKELTSLAGVTSTSPSLVVTPAPGDTATPTVGMSKTNSMVSMLADDLEVSGVGDIPRADRDNQVESSGSEIIKSDVDSGEQLEAVGAEAVAGENAAEGDIAITESINKLSLKQEDEESEEGPLPTANLLFADAPEVPFPVNIGVTTTSPVQFIPPMLSQSVFSPIPPGPDSSLSFPINQAIKMVPETPAAVLPLEKSPYTAPHPSYDAWIPSEETKSILISVATSVPPGSYTPNPETFTCPGIILEDDLIDRVGANISRLFGESEASRRKILTADSVAQDDNGLKELIKLGCYRSAVNLTKRLLTQYGQGPGRVGQFTKHSPHSLQLWFTRISLLVRIREFSFAEQELQAFNNFENPDMYYDFYPELHGLSRGSMVPFYLRLLAAEIPQYMRKFNETINKLYHMLYIVEKIIQNLENGCCEDGNPVTVESDYVRIALDIWKKREIRVLYSLANSSLFVKDYYNAHSFLEKLCVKDSEHRSQLQSAIGRLFLQHGDQNMAQVYFEKAGSLRNEKGEDNVDTLVDSALKAISENNYTGAIELYKEALELQPDNFMITNNMAVCLLYLGKVKESVALMESTVRQNVPHSLQENVILNLSSIYELENSDSSKKHNLLKLISEYKGDGINLASLKMPNLI